MADRTSRTGVAAIPVRPCGARNSTRVLLVDLPVAGINAQEHWL